MDTINYNNKEYPTRTFVVHHSEMSEPSDTTTYTIGVESLLDDMKGEDVDIDFSNGKYVEEAIDNKIYHYVEDEVILLDAADICANHLDIPMTFIEEI